MEKKLITEDFGATFGLIIAALLVGDFLTTIFTKYKSTKELPIPNQNVLDAINQLWYDDGFKKEVAKIISDEGDFGDILRKIEFSIDNPDSQPNRDAWKKINRIDFKPNTTAKRIVSRIVKTASFKGIAKKYKFTKQDSEDAIKTLYFVITNREFWLNAQKYIKLALKPSFINKLIGNPNIKPFDFVRSGGPSY